MASLADNLNLKIYCDGGARGNPGPAASAFVVYDDKNKLIYQQSDYLGFGTNNTAEYQAVINALSWLRKFTRSVSVCDFYLDSLLVVNQILGLYKIKDAKLTALHALLRDLLSQLPEITVNFTHVPRTQNQLADYLVNQTLDQQN